MNEESVVGSGNICLVKPEEPPLIYKRPTPNLASALSNAQAMMVGAVKDKKNDFFKSSYADMASAIAAIREPFAENGLAISQTMDVLPNGVCVIKTRLMHESGEYIDSSMPLPILDNPQKTGTAITYYRRYMLMAICNLAPVEDDGNSATNISPKHVAQLEDMVKEYPAIRESLMQSCQGNLHNLTLDRFPGCVEWINNKIDEVKNG